MKYSKEPKQTIKIVKEIVAVQGVYPLNDGRVIMKFKTKE